MVEEGEMEYVKEVEKIRKIPVDERGKYYERLFFKLIADSDQKGVSFRNAGMTPAQIKKFTGINENTVDKYLKSLFLKRKVYRVKVGNSYKYFSNGKIAHAITDRDIVFQDKRYRIYQIVNPDGDFIYIQEKEIDENGFEEVVGGVTIPSENAEEICRIIVESLDERGKIRNLEE